jgi:hypothetical protein
MKIGTFFFFFGTLSSNGLINNVTIAVVRKTYLSILMGLNGVKYRPK